MTTKPLQVSLLVTSRLPEIVRKAHAGMRTIVMHWERPMGMSLHPYIPVDNAGSVIGCSAIEDEVAEALYSPLACAPADKLIHVFLFGWKIAPQCAVLQRALNELLHFLDFAGEQQLVVHLANAHRRIVSDDIAGPNIHLSIGRFAILPRQKILPGDGCCTFYTLPRKDIEGKAHLHHMHIKIFKEFGEHFFLRPHIVFFVA